MNTQVISEIDNIIKKFKSNSQYELELKYDDEINKETFEKVVEKFKKQKMKMTKTKTLDIFFLHQNNNYRITIDDTQIDAYSKTNKLTSDMIKEFIIKKRIDNYKPLMVSAYNIKINMNEEIPITDTTKQNELLSILSSELKGFRNKSRYSFISKDGVFRYDFTEVNNYLNANPKKMNSNTVFSIANILKDDINYELEIEVINRDLIVAKKFLDQGINLYKLIHEKEIKKPKTPEPESKMEWMLPNRIGYGDKIFKTFRPENYDANSKVSCECDDKGVCDISNKSVSLFPQQRLIKDFIQFNSPYRGALLYHELGSGKSGASIAAAEGYINKKKMFVLSPASLAVNYENEILKISSIGLNLKKDWALVKIGTKASASKILLEKYAIDAKIIKKDLMVWIPLYEDDIPNATIIKTVVEDKDKTAVDLMISHIIRNRYTFISYNGLNQKLLTSLGKSPFDNSFVIIDETHNFASRIVNGSKLARDVYMKLMNATDCKIILLSGTPIINNPYEIATIINLIRGHMKVYSFPYLKTSRDLQEDELKLTLEKSNLLSFIDEYHVDNKNKRLLISLLPKDYKRISIKETDIKKKEWESSEIEILNSIIETINGLKGVRLAVKSSSLFLSALPTTIEEFNSYFMNMNDEDNPQIKNEDLFMRRILGTVSYYSISGSDKFPKRLTDVTNELYMTDNQFKRYTEVRAIERKMDMKKGGVMDDKTSVYRAFSRMVCNFSFPEGIERLYPNDVKKALKKEMDQMDEDRGRRERSEKAKVVDIYEKKLTEAIDELKDKDFLTYDNVKKTLSPKFASMYDDVEASPGSVLIYSQFRNVEGLGLFSEFLNRNGYKEIDMKKVNGEYQLTDPTVFNPRYDNKRFVIFSQDREKTRYLMNLFNGDFSNLPPKIVEAMPEDKNQLYGKLVKIFCITASGAEGISLKNVRRVLIAEPYWNNIRIEQVIGRAIRSCSHETLPLKDRNVTVFRYIMKFTKKQLEKDYSIQTLDKGITTDEHIQMMANKKMAIIDKFLRMLKAASFDCIINAKQNKPLANGYKCYNWALGVNKDDLSYTSDIKDDYNIMKHKSYQIARKNKGRVILKNGKKYVVLNGKVYNYHSYVNAGILISEEI